VSIDDNDRLRAGTLPNDPADDTKIVASDAPRVLTVRDLLRGARIDADRKNLKSLTTTGNYKLDSITGGMIPGFVWVFGADTSWGKCLGRNTPVMRSDGTTCFAQEVRDGDRLMGPDSKPRTVVGTTSGRGKLFMIIPTRGEPWVCNWKHVLVVVSTRTNVTTEISVEDFLKKSPPWRHQQKLLRVKPKQLPNTEPRTNVKRVGFSIEPIDDGQFFGWELDGDGLFLLGDCTVTHNSSFLVMIADENLKRKKRILVVSAEDSEKLYGDRLMLRRTRNNANRLRSKKVTPEEREKMLQVEEKAEESPVFLDARGRGVEWVSRNVKQIIKEQQIDVVAYDYLQAFDNEKPQQDRRNQVTYIARTLTDITKSLDKTGIIFSQITVEKGKPMPDKHSIRESRDVSNAAEVVLLGFIPEKDLMGQSREAGRPPELLVGAGDKAILVDKCKNGPRGAMIRMPWDNDSACFDTVLDPETERLSKFVDAAGNFSDFDNDDWRTR